MTVCDVLCDATSARKHGAQQSLQAFCAAVTGLNLKCVASWRYPIIKLLRESFVSASLRQPS